MLGGMIRSVSFCPYTTDNSSEFTFVLTAFRNGYLKGARLLYTYSAHMPSGAKAWGSILSHALAQLYERTLFNSADIGA